MIVQCPHCSTYLEVGYNADSAICCKCGGAFNIATQPTAQPAPTIVPQLAPTPTAEKPKLSSGAQSAIAICQLFAILCLLSAIAAPFILKGSHSAIYIGSGIGGSVFWYVLSIILRAVCSKK